MGYIGVQIYTYKSEVSGVHWSINIHLLNWGKWATVEYIGVQIDTCKSGVSGIQWGTLGVQIYICKSGVSGVHWGTHIHLQKWGTFGYKYTFAKVG